MLARVDASKDLNVGGMLILLLVIIVIEEVHRLLELVEGYVVAFTALRDLAKRL